jgi:hypothetical protein
MVVFLESLLLALQEHAVKIIVGFAAMSAGWYFGRRRAQSSWLKREFLDRLNVSLNVIADGKLKIRTLSEKRCADVFLNSVASETIQRTARQTTATDPLLPLSKDDTWYYLNAVLNDLSEQFALGHLQQDLGMPVKSATYLVCLTCESFGELRTRKVRAMVMRKDALINLPKEQPQLAASHHTTRWATLQFMAAEYARNPWRFLEVELSA